MRKIYSEHQLGWTIFISNKSRFKEWWWHDHWPSCSVLDIYPQTTVVLPLTATQYLPAAGSKTQKSDTFSNNQEVLNLIKNQLQLFWTSHHRCRRRWHSEFVQKFMNFTSAMNVNWHDKICLARGGPQNNSVPQPGGPIGYLGELFLTVSRYNFLESFMWCAIFFSCSLAPSKSEVHHGLEFILTQSSCPATRC